MSGLSESLRDLASRLERLEDSAQETAFKGLKTFEEAESDAKRQASGIQKAGRHTAKEAQRWWSDTRGAIEGQISAMRTNIDQFEREFKRRAK